VAVSCGGKFQPVRNDHVGPASRRPSGNQIHEIDDIGRIEALGGLVNDQHFWSQDIMGGMDQTLTLSPAQAPGSPRCQDLQSVAAQNPGHLTRRGAASPQLTLNSCCKKLKFSLRHHQGGPSIPTPPTPTGLWFGVSGHHACQAGLAHPVVPGDDDDLTLPDFEIDPFKQLAAADGYRHPASLEDNPVARGMIGR
jgi:hypothetical protein